MTTCRFSPPKRLASGRCHELGGDLLVHVAAEGIADEIPLLEARHHVVEAQGQLADLVLGANLQGLAVFPPGYQDRFPGDPPDGRDQGPHSQADEDQTDRQTEEPGQNIVKTKVQNGGHDLFFLGMEHNGPGSPFQPIKPDYLVTAHHRPIRLPLHLLEHGQFQGVLGLAQAVPGFHRRVGVGQKSAVVIHQTGHVGVKPAGAAHPFHQIIEFYRHLKTPQGMSRPIQQRRSQADGLMIRGIKKLGRRNFGHPGGQASAPPALLDQSRRRPAAAPATPG